MSTVGRLRPSLEAMRRIELGLLLGNSLRRSGKLAPLGYMLLSLSTSFSVQPRCLISIVNITYGCCSNAGSGNPLWQVWFGTASGYPDCLSQFSPPQSVTQANPGYCHDRRAVRAVNRGGSLEPPALRD
jgi:hypothetical protein